MMRLSPQAIGRVGGVDRRCNMRVAKPTSSGRSGLVAPFGIIHRDSRKTACPVDERMPVARDTRRKDPDLAIADLVRAGSMPRAAPQEAWACFRKPLVRAHGSPCHVPVRLAICHQHRVKIDQQFQGIVALYVAQDIPISVSAPEYHLRRSGPLVAGIPCPQPAGLPSFLTRLFIEKIARRGRGRFLQERHPRPRLHIPRQRNPETRRVLAGQSRHP